MLFNWTGFGSQTWSAYGAGIQTDGIEASASAAASKPTGVGTGLQPFNVTASLQAWSDSADNNGWLITSTAKTFGGLPLPKATVCRF